MAMISVEVGEDCLRFSTPGVDDLRVPMAPTTGDRRQVTIWQSVCAGEVYDESVNEWFCKVLETDCQLVHMPDTTERHVSKIFDSGNDIVSFADGYPLLLIGENSLADLNARLADTDVRGPLPMNRFRPNVVVTGSDGFAEDKWARIRIGEATFRVAKPCARCVITTVDQSKGEFDGKEPLRTFAKFRAARDVYPNTYESFGIPGPDVLFGQNLIPETTNTTIRTGDAVEVLDVKESI